MLAPEAVPALVPAAVSTYLCLLGPGHAWWRGRGSALPRPFARVAVSVAWTSMCGLWLTALGLFSLPRVVVINGLVTLVGYLLVARAREEGLPPPAHAGAGLVVCAVALVLYWPPYEAYFAGSDATTYTTAGVHLARAQRLSKVDPLLDELSPALRRRLFRSALGRPWSPPYSRMPGGMVMAGTDSDVAHPNFFPVPSVWSALFADALGPRYAGGYAPLFAALAVWATWAFARRRFGPAAAGAAVGLTMLNAASYYSGRLAMSEPLAWFFLFAGLCALDAWEEDGMPVDAGLAGLLLGMAGFARIDYLMLVTVALGCRYLLGSTLGCRPLARVFTVVFCATAVAAVLEVWMVQGAYATPLTDTWDGLLYRLETTWSRAPLAPLLLAAAGATLFALAVVRVGVVRGTLFTAVAGFLVAYTVFASHPKLVTSCVWLGAYLGWTTLALAAVGFIDVWRRRFTVGGDGFFLLLVLIAGGLVVYDPHVYPVMPWAARRFVPLVVPASLLLAAAGAARLGRRSLLLGAVAWTVLVAGVLLPARGLWAKEFYRGSYDQLAELNALVPDDGVLLIDARLDAHQLGTPLWLAYDRDSLPVETMSLRGRRVVASAVFQLVDAHPVYLLRPTLGAAKPIPFVAQRKAADYTLQVLLPEQTAARPPLRAQNYTTSVSLFRLRRLHLPAPAAAPATPPAEH